MDWWIKNEKGQVQFMGGKQDWLQVASIASNCPDFAPDYEEELLAEEEISCYNCRFRRWTEGSFTCSKR